MLMINRAVFRCCYFAKLALPQNNALKCLVKRCLYNQNVMYSSLNFEKDKHSGIHINLENNPTDDFTAILKGICFAFFLLVFEIFKANSLEPFSSKSQEPSYVT